MSDLPDIPFPVVCMEKVIPLVDIDPLSPPTTWAEAARPRNRWPSLTFQHRVLQYHLDVEKLAQDLLPPVVSHWTLHQHLSIMFDALITPYNSATDVNTNVAERLHDRLGLPQDLKRIVKPGKYSYTTFDIGLVGGPALFTAEYEEGTSASESNAKYFFLCHQVINEVRQKVPTVPFTYSWIPGAITRDKENIVAWSLNEFGPGFVLREKITGTPLREFLERKNMPDAIKAALFFQLLYTISSFQDIVKGQTLDHDSIVVRDLAVQLDTAFGELFCPYLVGITNFREIAVKMKGVEIGYRECKKFTAVQEAQHLLRTLAPVSLQSVANLKDFSSMLRELIKMASANSLSLSVEIGSPVADECVFYRKYFALQPLTEIGYIDTYALLSDEAGGAYIEWINSVWNEEEVIAQATELIQYCVERCQELMGGGNPIITDAVAQGNVYNFVADLGELSAYLFSIITLINGVMNAVYLNTGQGQLVFPSELMAQVQPILTFHTRELKNIGNVLTKSPASKSSASRTPSPGGRGGSYRGRGRGGSRGRGTRTRGS